MASKYPNEYLKNAYRNAKNRCRETYPRRKDYYDRGIRFCFNSFEEFYEEIWDRPSSLYSVDRIDNDWNYEKGNIRWATKKEQSRNNRNNRRYYYKGESKTISEWSECINIEYSTLICRIKRWGSFSKAIETPYKWEKQIYLNYNGDNYNLEQWSIKTGLTITNIRTRISRGWSIERTLTQPAQKKKTT